MSVAVSTILAGLADDLISFAQAGKLLPTKKAAPSTFWRWRTVGVKVRGTRIRLECYYVNGAWYTTKAALDTFFRRQTEARLAAPIESAERSEGTERRLAAAGLA